MNNVVMKKKNVIILLYAIMGYTVVFAQTDVWQYCGDSWASEFILCGQSLKGTYIGVVWTYDSLNMDGFPSPLGYTENGQNVQYYSRRVAEVNGILPVPNGAMLLYGIDIIKNTSVIYSTTNDSRTWQGKTNFSTYGIDGGGVTALILSRHGVLYCGNKTAPLFRSTDMGETWQRMYHDGGAIYQMYFGDNDDLYITSSFGFGGAGHYR